MPNELDFEELIGEIQNDIGTPLVMRVSDDSVLEKNISEQFKEENEEYNQRNKLYTQLMDNYIKSYTEKEKNKAIYKGFFFFTTMILFVLIVMICLYSMIRLSLYGDGSLVNVGIAITNIAGIITTIVVLPKIIAEHLFPKDEESNMISMVQKMQENDSNIRDMLHSDKKINK